MANGRRIVMVAKTGTYYEMMHLGLFRLYATPGQYPYPLLVGGTYNSSTRWSNSYQYRNHLPKSSGLRARTTRRPGWTGVSAMLNSWGSNTRECPDGSYPLLLFILNGLGRWTAATAFPVRQCGGEHHQRRRRRSSGGAGRVRTGYSDYWA